MPADRTGLSAGEAVLSRAFHPIVVAGGGIGGLAAALGLARRGHRVLVAEARIGGGEVGAGLQLSPNASHILQRWGLGPALAQFALEPEILAIRRWGESRPFAAMPFERHADGAPFWGALRADLHRTLRDAVIGAGAVELREGLSLQRLQETGDRLLLTFRAGEDEIEVATLCLIGADGQRSTARRLFGDARDLDTPGWEAWRTVIPAEAAPEAARRRTTNLWLGRDGHAVHYPVAGGGLVNLVLIRRSAARGEGWSRTGEAREIAPLLAQAAPELKELAQQAPNWAVWTLRDRSPSPRLAHGACALVGDAAHPVLPFLAQGAAMAIEDAAVLAASLPGPEELSRFTVSAGLVSYARARAPRVDRVFKAARANAFNYHLPAPLAWLRDRRIAQLGADGMRQRYSWLYDWRAPADRP